ncbi:unnamed protein product [Parnassius apollo]|uniref:(apollo) hypothetical protein n=1 Tax=Parnassius apollo TaxID=110799 RepID=A0A8S3WTI1_PARAO|nr:unnamed protein product [Parnassius apollo]
MVPVTNKHGHVAQKPEAIAKYNEIMSGADWQDQLLAFYPCERKILRWYLKVAIHIFQLLLINSFKIYNKYSGQSKMTLYDYRLSVISALKSDKHVTTNPGPVKRQVSMLHKIVAFEHSIIVILSLLTLRPGALISLEDTNVLLDNSLHNRPLSPVL